MKLNRTRPYGTITGHASACFEQNGVLFDGAGEQLAEYTPASKKPGPKPKEPAFETLNDKALANACAFLQNLLKGGPLDKSVVFKEADGNNQHWDTVKLAFEEIKGKASKRGQSTMWALNYETV